MSPIANALPHVCGDASHYINFVVQHGYSKLISGYTERGESYPRIRLREIHFHAEREDDNRQDNTVRHSVFNKMEVWKVAFILVHTIIIYKAPALPFQCGKQSSFASYCKQHLWGTPGPCRQHSLIGQPVFRHKVIFEGLIEQMLARVVISYKVVGFI